MTKFKLGNVATILVMAVMLTACAGTPGNGETNNPASEQSEATSDSVKPSESETTSEVETTTESESTTENEESLPEGWTRLTDDELKYFNEEFFNVDGNTIVNSFLNCTYVDVKEISFYDLFYDCPHQSTVEITDEEMALIKASDIYFETDTQKVPLSYMNEMLSTYANLTVEETDKTDLDKFLYLEEYGAYYICHGDTHYSPVTVESGMKDENGTIKIQCLQTESENRYEVTLKAHDNGYYFVSNTLVEQ